MARSSVRPIPWRVVLLASVLLAGTVLLAAPALGAMPSVTGTVTDAGTSLPLGDVDVIAYAWVDYGGYGSWEPVELVSTDASGGYEFYGLGPGEYRIGFSDWSHRYVDEYFNDRSDLDSATSVHVTAGNTTSGVDAALTPSPLSIAGTVTDEETGDPLDGIGVDPYYFYDPGSGDGWWEWVGWSTQTAADGRYSIYGLDTGQYVLEFYDMSGRYAGEYYNGKPNDSVADLVAVTRGAITSNINAALTPLPPTISGVVTEEGTGTLLEGVEVTAYQDFGGGTWERVDSTFTTTDGTYQFYGLNGQFKIGFTDLYGHAAEFYNDRLDIASADLITATLGATTSEVDAVLGLLPPSITGTVTDEVSGEPIEDVEVWACYWDADSESWVYAAIGLTNADGVYELRGLDGQYKISFDDWSGGHLTEYYHDKPDLASADLVTASHGGTTSGIDAELAPNQAPVLDPIGAKSVTELSLVSFTATADDADLPPQTLTFSLEAGAPSGASITEGGVFTWTPSEVQGPEIYNITVVVSDGQATDSEIVSVNVSEANAPPVLFTIGNRSVNEGTLLLFTATAIDFDLPAQTLTFSLEAGAPSGASITEGGVFTWTPSEVQGPEIYNITVFVSDGHAISSETISVTVNEVVDSKTYTPIDGATRISTAIRASEKAFPDGAANVVIATAFNWPDALGGSALAGVLQGPILLTGPNALPEIVAEEIDRLHATKAYILGGEPAVSKYVMQQVQALGIATERIGGTNRYDTANKVAKKAIELKGDDYDGTAFVATGLNFPDALGASPLAANKVWPIYLTNPAWGNNQSIVNTMESAEVTRAIVLGGPNVVSDSIATALQTAFGSAPTRLSGSDRYATAIAVAHYGVTHESLTYDKVAIATGQNFPDALAGGVLQGEDDSVMLLTPTASLYPNLYTVLHDNKPTINEVRFLGGLPALSQAVRDQVAEALEN